MELVNELKNIDAPPKKIKSFGHLFAFIGIVGGILLFVFSSIKLALIFGIVGLAFLLLTYTSLKILKPLFLVWMTLAFVLGFVVSNVILVIFFYLVITPISILGRMSGKKFLNVSWRGGEISYWVKRKTKLSKENFEKQF